MTEIAKDPIDLWLVDPIKQFINNASAGGVVLFVAALIALVLSNSPWAHQYHAIWELEISIKIGDLLVEKTLHHWINDGLVAVFFFVVGLELKREVLAGELRELSNAILPISAAVGGTVLPAAIYLLINQSGPSSDGWGIPMATDIAFALGVVYLLGDRVPTSIKVFLTTLAIADDLAAVLIIAFFYTSSIDVTSLLIGIAFLLLLIFSNRVGIRSTLYYAVLGVAGLWFTFLLSGIHPTIAAVLVAFTIPAKQKVTKPIFSKRLEGLLRKFRGAKTIEAPVVSREQLKVVSNIREVSKRAIPPLQRLEHDLHPFVSFLVMPIFALSNAGVTLSGDLWSDFTSPVSIGVFFGLLVGKVFGVSLMVMFMTRLNLAKMPAGITIQHLLGMGFLAAIGFTMSIFITELAFDDVLLIQQAKIAIFAASLVGSIGGFLLLRSASPPLAT